MKRLISFMLSVLVSLTTWANYQEFYVNQEKLPFTALDNAKAYYGVFNKAGYRIEVPDDWNGELVMWAHGFRRMGTLELTVDNHPMRAFLISQGYAWAASSYSRNDYDVSTAVQDTLALMKRFNGLVGKPSKAYMTGLSMGGHVSAIMIEQFPQMFAGAMPVCGALNDYENFDFILDFNLGAQQLALGSSIFPVQPETYVTQTVPSIKQNLQSQPGGWPVLLNQQGEKFRNLVMMQSGGVRPNFIEGFIFWNSFPDIGTGPGNFVFDLGLSNGVLPRNPGIVASNDDVIYQLDADPTLTAEEQAFNDAIYRLTLAPQTHTENGLSQVPVVNGDIKIPVLTMHNLGDLYVPFKSQIDYAKRVQSHGKSDLLVTRAYRGVLHCDFTAQEMVRSFLDLVEWVETGNKPVGDDLLDQANVAANDFGCQFTDGYHLLGTPCP
ncbi:phthalyl amidase [Thalassotalea sp. HSM 43]|uniref:phthalyl amidase n=1 Tax=Thalassotalea sp. HSM 43 TaxID=2552945 RepID=UPI0010821EEE|nr:phthalyl amidase [Thalassotalea sp. HSM 43]QBY02953.1 phthalyl amidase [Thalassotalea sp. HSM 43]